MILNNDKINLFEKIDTEEKAYWLGLLMADGSIAWRKTKSGIKLYGIKLGLCDIDVMDKYKEFMGIPKDFPYQILIQDKCQPVYYLYVTCHKMAEDLGKHGMIPSKTHRTIVPNLPDELLRHFIRGYFDGDGCIYIRERKVKDGSYKRQRFIAITSCSDKLLKQIEQICKDNNLIRKNKTFLRYPKTYKNKTHPPFFGLNHRVDIVNFLNFIYKNAIVYMDRKYKLYLLIKDDARPHRKDCQNPTNYYGVSFIRRNTKNPYKSGFIYNTIAYSLGYFKTAKEAAIAYNNKILELGLPETMLNKIEENPPETSTIT